MAFTCFHWSLMTISADIKWIVLQADIPTYPHGESHDNVCVVI